MEKGKKLMKLYGQWKRKTHHSTMELQAKCFPT